MAAITLVACSPKAPPSRMADPRTQVERLGHIVERYWDENAARMPWYSWGDADFSLDQAGENIAPQFLADSLAIERRFFDEVLAVPRSTLNAESALTYDIFRRERALAIEGFIYPRELLPVNPYDGMPQRFALMATAAEHVALSSATDFENWRSRTMAIVTWTNQAIANMRNGIRRGYTLPRGLVEKTLPQLAALGEDSPMNVFYQPLRMSPGPGADSVAGLERVRSSAAMTAVLKEKILPAYRALHDFLLHEYLPRARNTVGLTALPLGDAWYAFLVKRTTSSALTPMQLHTLGLAEIQRLHQRVPRLLAEASSPGFSYKTSAGLLGAYQDLTTQLATAAPALFSTIPKATFEIRSVESFREAVAPALSYAPRAPNDLVAAVLYVNTAALDRHPATLAPAQFLREAVPGHHYQLEVQHERADLPRFRRFGGVPAFTEGWGLYAATLGEELGVYPDEATKSEPLLAQVMCAAGLVIDTGLHAQGWTRQQALDYLRAELSLDTAAAGEAVDRVIAHPAQALACTVGFLKIDGLRALAQQGLGARFDLRQFHAEIIKDGSMPLDLLEAKVKRWMETAAQRELNLGFSPSRDSN